MNTIVGRSIIPQIQIKLTSPKIASFLVALLSLLIITQVVVAATAVNLCLVSGGAGQSLTGTLGGVAKNVWGGVFHISINGIDQNGYCTDLNNGISIGQCYSSSVVGASAPQVACTVKNYPPLDTLTNAEAAARQAAVWKFSDGYIVTGPTTVKTRAEEIIADINAKTAAGLCDPAPAPTLMISPSSATNFLIPDGSGYLYSPHDFTIKLMQGTQPLANKAVHVTTSAGVFDPSGLTAVDVTTDSNGEAIVTVKNNVVATATLTATSNVTLPAGTRIDPGAEIQKIVLNGTTEYPMSATATKQWVAGSKIIVMKFQDTNRNQVKESDEPWLKWKIFYREHTTPQVFPPTTGWSSAFTDLSTGTLVIGVDATKTYDICENVYASDATLIDWEATTPQCYWNVAPGSVSWFGNVRKPAIWIYKYLDYNGNGVQDAGEPGADGWEFQVDRWDREGTVWSWQPTYSGQTSGGGYLGFSYVLSKNSDGGSLKYRITEILPPDWNLSGPTANSVEFTITGQEVYSFTFGNLKPGKLIIDKHWYASNLEVNPPATPASVCIKPISLVNPFNNLIPQDAAQTPLTANASGYYCQNISSQVTFKNLWPGIYDVVETSPSGWTGQAVIDDQTIISAGIANLSIRNDQDDLPVHAKVQKISVPAGYEAGWKFDLMQGAAVIETVTTTGAGFVNFIANLQSGSYMVVEQGQAGWTVDKPNGCPITVSLPLDAGKVFECVFTNTANLAHAKVQKISVPAGYEAGWKFDLMQGATVIETVTTTGAGFVNFIANLQSGSYMVVEQGQAGWTVDKPNGCPITVSLPLDADKVFECVFTNTANPAHAKVQKISVPAGYEAGWKFDLMQGAAVIETVTTTGAGFVNFIANLQSGSYMVVEQGQAGWTVDKPNGCPITVSLPLDAGKVFECVFTNTANLAHAKVQKISVPAGYEAGWKFDLMQGATVIETVTTTGAGFVNFIANLQSGSYMVVEQGQAGWTVDKPNGCPITVSLPLDTDKVFECVFTNTANPAHAKVQKISVPVGYEAGWKFDLMQGATVIETVTTTGAGFVSFNANLQSGSYMVVEQGQAGWTVDKPNGCPITVSLPLDTGKVFECVFTNTANAAHAKVQKISVPAGYEAGWKFDLMQGATVIETVTTTGAGFVSFNADLQSGSYMVVEQGQAGWTVDKPNGCPITVSLPLDADKVFECVFTNTANPAHAKVQKISVPAGYEAGWKFDLMQGATVIETVTTTGAGFVNFNADLQSGSYMVVEQGQAGWTVDKPNGCPITVSLPLDADKVFECVFTNTANPAHAKVQKISVPAGYEAGWKFDLMQGATVIETVTTTGAGFVNFNADLQSGSYMVVEQGQAGWTVDKPNGCPITVSLPLDADKVFECVFTNTANAAHAKVQKISVPAGYEAGWKFDLMQGATVIETVTTTGAGFVSFNANLQSGSYMVVEQGQAGWTVDKPNGCPITVSLPLDADKVLECVFTNTANAAHAKVQKISVPAGYETGWKFDLMQGATVLETVTTTGAGFVNFIANLQSGSYMVVEQGQAGWTVDKPNGCPITVSLPLDAGKVFECVFTNTANPAHAKVQKISVPAGYEAGWKFDLMQGATVIETVTTTGAGFVNFNADLQSGSYMVVEQGQAGWTVDKPNGCPITVSLPLDADKVFECVFTNTANAAHAKVQKISVPAGYEAGWKFDLMQGATVIETVTTTGAGFVSFNANLQSGSYMVVEQGQAGWTVDKPNGCPITVSLPLDADKVFECVFTNTANPAHAKVQKISVPAGYEAGWKFDLMQGATVIETVTTTGAGFVNFNANLQSGSYVVVEQGQAGWTVDKPNGCPITVSLPLDADKVFECVFSNLKHATAKVQKVTIPVGFEMGWSFTLKNAEGQIVESGITNSNGVINFAAYLNAGIYTIEETLQNGWINDKASCQITVVYPNDAGKVLSCTFTNTKLADLKVIKVVDWKGNPVDQQQSFTICIQGLSFPNGNEQGACQTVTYQGGEVWWHNLLPGQYIVSEQDPGGQWIVDITTSPINLTPGASGEVTVKNTRRLGGLTVTKVVDWNGSAVDAGQQFTICIQGPSYPLGSEPLACKLYSYTGGTLVWDGLLPGQYVVSEQDPGSHWSVVVDVTPVSVSIYGQDAHVNVINTHKRGNLKVVKTVNWSGMTPDQAKVFTICIQGPSYPTTANCKVTDFDGGALVWENLIPGGYQVTEQNPGSEWAVTVPLALVQVVGDGSTVEVGVTNVYKKGDLEVTKVVDWGTAEYDPTKIFTICIKGLSYPLGTETGACKTVGADGGIVLWQNLIPGSYEIMEEFPGGEWLTFYDVTPTVVTGGQKATAIVTNRNTSSTAVTLKYFKAQWVHGKNVNLTWATAIEMDNYGFDVYRSAANDYKTAEKVGFVESQAGTGKGSVYSYVDSSAPKAGQYYYWLVDVSNAGKQTLNGDPLKGLAVKVWEMQLYLPGVMNH